MRQDLLLIRQLRVTTRIGVYDWERCVPQTLLLDLDIQLAADAVSRAAAHDCLDDALDYSALAVRIHRFAETASFQLLESFAEKLAQALIQEYALQGLKLSVYKPGAIAEASAVGVVIERGPCP